MSKVTKCPKLQSDQNYKMSKTTKYPKFQNVQGYKISKVKTFCFICTIFLFI